MTDRTLNYFVSDVHLGLQVNDPAEREARFISFLRSIPKDRTQALYMLGDIWDFWYEWKHVVPKGYIKVFSALIDLMDAGVTVYFFQGNHDVWTYHYFEDLGMKRLVQPAFVEIGGKTFCLGHGDALGSTSLTYRCMRWAFHNKCVQWLFSTLLHPTVSMSFGHAWSRNNRLAKRAPYVWKGAEEPLYKYCCDILRTRHVDWFVFGHLHVSVEDNLPRGAKLKILDSWIFKENWFCYEINQIN